MLFLHSGGRDWFQDLPKVPESGDAQVPWSAYSLMSHTHCSVAANSNNIGLCIKFALQGSLNPGINNQGIWRVDYSFTEENPHVSEFWNSKALLFKIIFVFANGTISFIFMAE